MPVDYHRLKPSDQKQARMDLLTGWWDIDRMGLLISDHRVFVTAFFFYVAFYVKRSAAMRAYYYRKTDCIHKKTFIMDMEKRRFLTIAPRGSSKTFTLCYECCPFIAQFRPQTEILICGENWDMTCEKLANIKDRMETNELLHIDFPEFINTRRWSTKRLSWQNGSTIGASSIDAATRGRHPLLGLIDDPEGKKARKSAQWRKDFLKWVSADFMGQFDDKGSIVGWIGTILNNQSCLNQAFHDMDPEGKFKNFAKRLMQMVWTDTDTGQKVSAWPEKLTVDEFNAKMKYQDSESGNNVTVIGAAAVMAEFQGTPIPDGERMFVRDEKSHGYMVFQDEKNGKMYVWFPDRDEVVDYNEWLEVLYKYTGADVADTEESSADYSAITCMGVDRQGVKFVLDAWQKRIWSEKLLKYLFAMNNKWECVKSGIEKAKLSNRLLREKGAMRKEYQEKEFHTCSIIGRPHGNLPKPERVERMQGDWNRNMIKLPILEKYDGLEPHRHENTVHLVELVGQFDLMTNEGTGGADDLIDSCEVAHNLIVARPQDKVAPNHDHLMLEKFKRDLGVEFPPSLLQPQSWTPEMIEAMGMLQSAEALQQAEFDPYGW